MSEDETLRFPTNLDHAAIVARLARVRDSARAGGLAELAARFASLETMSAPQIGAAVIGALTWLQERHDLGTQGGALARELEMVAMNLKNL